MQERTGRLRTFYLLVVTQTLSLVGSQMTGVALGIHVFRKTGNTTPLLLASFFNELPAMLGGSLAGVLVDRWERRRVLALADAGQAVGSLLLLLIFLTGRFELWHLYAVALLQGTFATFQQPAENASLTVLVPESRRERANALREMAFPFSGMVAPVFAGALYALVGVTGVIAIDLVTFLVAVGAILLVRIPRPTATPEGLAGSGNLWQELVGSFRYLIRRRALLILVLYLTFTNFLLNGPLQLALPYLLAVTGSEARMGLLMSVMSLGAFSGAALLTLWGGTRPRIHTLLIGGLLNGLMFLLFGTARRPLLLAPALFLLMAPLPVSNALFNAILQRKTPPDMQGRLFAVVAQLGYLGATASFLLAGPLVDRVLQPGVDSAGWRPFAPLVGQGPGAAIGLLLFCTGLLMLLSTSLVYLLPSVRHLEAELPDYAAIEEQSNGL